MNGSTKTFRKDATLNQLAEQINVAQFVSFSPGKGSPNQEFSRIFKHAPNKKFRNLQHAIEALFENSSDHMVNVRSFLPDDHQSKEFVYGITSIEKTCATINRLTKEGLFTIANETIDVSDGGVSGVIMGGVLEFSPDDTPRCVEKSGTVSIPKKWGISILEKIYGFTPDLSVNDNQRLEFSIHPKPRGWKRTHTLGWELEAIGDIDIEAHLVWPNRFSAFLGDKVFGLMVADAVGLLVPKSTVINRRIAPFSFGKETGSQEVWVRTSPNIQMPGKFTTNRGWLDPFDLLAREDPSGEMIPSILSQANVPAKYSGALIVASDGQLIIEGKVGEGETLMSGESKCEGLPLNIEQDVRSIFEKACAILGPVRFEWVHDGSRIWIVQLHKGITNTSGNVLVPGDATKWHEFDISKGLEALRNYIDQLLPESDGLLIKGDIGLTSHIADVIRKKGIPARIKSNN